MKWSFKIGSAFGIELRMHITFFLIVLFAAYIWGVLFERGYQGAVYGAALISVLFACVVIHELAHSLMAIHYGGQVSSITLLPIGGVSLLKNMPEDPMKELVVSVVGPMTNVVIGFLLIPLLYLIPDPVGGPWGAYADVDLFTGISVQAFISYLLFINFVLAFFNMVPAFPLDGGRVLRSILALKMSYVKATRAAVTIGQIFAFILGITGLLLGAWLWIIIAVFIYLGASQEGAGTEMKSILARLKVGQAMAGDVRVLSPEDRLSDVVGVALRTYQEDFPVVSDGRIEGMLTRSGLIKGLHDVGPEASVSEVMTREFPVVRADAPFSEVYVRMNEFGIKAVPVVEDGRLLGMVTMEHLSEVFMLLSATDQPVIPE
ncbi:MAG: site-2 protease family protein [Thermoleophilia bacterium]|nr:site-2 protease family protein [Thermoleophilia bacterium]